MSDLTGVGTILGSLIGGAFGYAGTQSTNAANLQIAQENIAAQRDSQATVMAYNQDQVDQARRYNSMTAQFAQDWTQQNMNLANQFNVQNQQEAQNYNWASMMEAERYNTQAQTESERYDTLSAQRQMDYQTLMSNTAYQRSVADMKAAGLNPILGVASGGASSPAGAGPTVSAPSVSPVTSGAPSIGGPAGPQAGGVSPASAPMISGAQATMQNPGAFIASGIKDAINSAFQSIKLNQDIQQTQANIGLTKAQTANTLAGVPGTEASASAASRYAVPQAAAVLENTLKSYGLTDAQTASAVAQASAAYAAAGASGAAAGQSEAQAAESRERTQKMLEAPPATMPGTTGLGSTMDYFAGRLNQATKALVDLTGATSNSAAKAAQSPTITLPPTSGIQNRPDWSSIP